MVECYWIIGFGKVGRRALARLHQKSPDADFAIVDPRYSGSKDIRGAKQWYAMDGTTFLLDRPLIGKGAVSPWIVPALPQHLAYEWIIARLQEWGHVKPCAVPREVVKELPNVIKGAEGQMYVSRADFICPDNCNEPTKKCPVTGNARSCCLYERLAGFQSQDYRSLVIRSFQLAPGVGGFRGSQLMAALTEIQVQPGKYLLSTASKCHGVMHAFETKAC